MLGLSFKAGTDDVRESPVVPLIETLVGRGYQLAVYDEIVIPSQLIGANKSFLERELPHIASLMTQECEDVVRNTDLVVVGLREKSLLQCLYDHGREDQTVLDLVNIPDRDRLRGTYLGVCW